VAECILSFDTRWDMGGLLYARVVLFTQKDPSVPIAQDVYWYIVFDRKVKPIYSSNTQQDAVLKD
jgi:hypothetical protein